MKVKKLLASLMAAIMVIGMVPITAMAAPTSNTKSITSSDGKVTLEKSTEWADLENGIAKVTMKVTDTGTSETKSVSTRVVLVIDRSGSMSDNDKMKNLKNALNGKDNKKGFFDNLFDGLTAQDDVQVAVVSYASDVQVNQGFTNDRNALKRAVNSIWADGATHIQAGIHKAQELLDAVTAENEIIIVLSDGEPTYSYEATIDTSKLSVKHIGLIEHELQGVSDSIITGYNYNKTVGSGRDFELPGYSLFGIELQDTHSVTLTCSGQHYISNQITCEFTVPSNNGVSTIKEAGYSKEKGAEIYAIGYGVAEGSYAEETMKGVATTDSSHYKLSSDADKVFESICDSVKKTIEASRPVVTDPIRTETALGDNASNGTYSFAAITGNASYPITATNDSTAVAENGKVTWKLTKGGVSELTFYVQLTLSNDAAPGTYTLKTNNGASMAYGKETLIVDDPVLSYTIAPPAPEKKTVYVQYYTEEANLEKTPFYAQAKSFEVDKSLTLDSNAYKKDSEITDPALDTDGTIKIAEKIESGKYIFDSASWKGDTLEVIYTADKIKEGSQTDKENDPTSGSDGIPDKYQATIIYTAGTGGSVSPVKKVVTIGKENPNGISVTASSVASKNAGYEFVKWDSSDVTTITTPTAPELSQEFTAKGGETYTFTASFKVPAPTTDQVTVEYYIENTTGTAVETEILTVPVGYSKEVVASTETTGLPKYDASTADPKFVVDKLITGKDGKNYTYDGCEWADSDKTLKVVYSLDEMKKGSQTDKEKDPTIGSDGIPDKYQVTVLYITDGNGTVSPIKEVLNITDTDGKFATSGTVTAQCKAEASEGYIFDKWLDKDSFIGNQGKDFKYKFQAASGGEYTFKATFKLGTQPPASKKVDVKYYLDGENINELNTEVEVPTYYEGKWDKVDGTGLPKYNSSTEEIYVQSSLEYKGETYTYAKDSESRWDEDTDTLFVYYEMTTDEVTVKYYISEDRENYNLYNTYGPIYVPGSYIDDPKVNKEGNNKEPKYREGEIFVAETLKIDKNTYKYATYEILDNDKVINVYYDLSDKEHEEYTVTFYEGKHGELDGRDELTCTEGEEVGYTPDVEPDKGYEFDGWYCEQTGKTYTDKQVKNMEVYEDLDFVAQYEKKGSDSGYELPEKHIERPEEKPELETQEHFQYISGYPDGTVRPNANITRAEVATIFYRLLSDDSRNAYYSIVENFSDVQSTDWYLKAVATLTNAGILHGDEGADTFRPNDSITRAEFATIVSFFDDLSYTGEDRFSDIAGHWANAYINSASANGWINGYPNGTYNPDAAITRAEAMTIINNVLGREVDGEGLHWKTKMWPDNPNYAWYYYEVLEATNYHDYVRENADEAEEWTDIRPNKVWNEGAAN